MYDFTTLVDRSGQGAEKWEDMLAKNPQTPDGVVPLSVADMELRNPPEIIKGLQDYLNDVVLGYTTATPAYAEAVCGWMRRRHDFAVDPSWIVTSSGVVPAFFAAVEAFTEPGDGILLFSPVYYPFYAAIERQGRRIVPSSLQLEAGRYVIDFDDFEKKAKDPKNKLLLFCSPHNPVSRVWTPEELQRVAAICLANDVLLCSDEIHFDLVMPGHTHRVFQTISEDIADRCITCTAPSKTFNLAGVQVSNIIIKNPALRERFRSQQEAQGFFSMNIFAFKACEIAYTSCEPWLEELLQHIAANERMVREYFAAYIPKIVPLAMEGTYLQWWDCRALGLDYRALEEFMLKEALLFLDEGYIFGDEGKGFERINLACPSAVLGEALDRLKDALERKNLL